MPPTHKASLIITFYGRLHDMPQLKRDLATTLGLVPPAFPLGAELHDPHARININTFKPHHAPDTGVVQLDFYDPNPPDDAASRWSALQRDLATKDFPALIQRTVGLWGYSFTYCAAWPDGYGYTEADLAALFALVSPTNPAPLAHTSLHAGDIWLMTTPSETEEAIYLALSPLSSYQNFIRQALYREAALLMPDLIMHKGYYEKRQYTTPPPHQTHSLRQLYKEQLNQLVKQLDLAWQTPTQALSPINALYIPLRRVTPRLSRLRASLGQQLLNHAAYHASLGSGNLAEFQYKQLLQIDRDLEILLNDSQEQLAAAQAVLDMIKMQLSDQQAQREQRLGATLTLIGLILAIPQLISPETALALYQLIFPLSGTLDDHRLLALALQLGFIIAIGLPAYYWIQRQQKL